MSRDRALKEKREAKALKREEKKRAKAEALDLPEEELTTDASSSGAGSE